MDWKSKFTRYRNKKWFLFLSNLIYNIKKDEVTAIGAQLTYYLILSIFPFFIFFLNVVGHTSLAIETLLNDWIILLPTETQTLLYRVIEEITLSSSETLLSLSIILALWSGSLGISAIIRAINKAYNISRKRNYIKLKILSLLFTIALVILLMIVLATLVFGEVIGNAIFTYIGAINVFYRVWENSRRVIALSSMIIIFALLYKYSIAPKERQYIKLVHTLPGAIFATIGWIVASGVFSFYVNNFANYSKTYGSLGGVIVLLVWLYITSIMIVLGGEINGTYASLFIFGRRDEEDRK